MKGEQSGPRRPAALTAVPAFSPVVPPISPRTAVRAVTMDIIDVSLGAAIAQRSITLPISPFDPSHPSPCVQLTVPATATSPAGPGELIAGAVILYPPQTAGTSSEALPPAQLTASVNVSGNSVQTIPIPIQTVGLSSGFSRR